MLIVAQCMQCDYSMEMSRKIFFHQLNHAIVCGSSTDLHFLSCYVMQIWQAPAKNNNFICCNPSTEQIPSEIYTWFLTC